MSTAESVEYVDVPNAGNGSKALSVAHGGSLFALDEKRVQQAEATADAQAKMLGVILRKIIPPHSWIDFGGNPYLEGGGAMRALHLFGISLHNRRWAARTATAPDGNAYTYIEATADLVERNGVKVGELIGTRDVDTSGYVKVEHHAIHAAFENGASHAVRELLGLKGMSWEDLAQYGVTRDGKGSVSFDSGSKGGKAAQLVPFGRDKGKRPDELDKDGIKFHLDAAKRDLADPSKEKFHKRTQAWLDALNAEIYRRQQVAAEQAAGATATGSDGPKTDREPFRDPDTNEIVPDGAPKAREPGQD